MRPLQGEGTRFRGIGKAMQSFLVEFTKLATPNQSFVLFVESGKDLPKDILGLFPNYETIKVPPSVLRNKKYIRVFASAHRNINPKPGVVDVLLQYDPTLGIPSSVPTVVQFHDLIPLLFKHKKSLKNENVLGKIKVTAAMYVHGIKYKRMLGTYRKAAHILAISESSRNDLLKYVGGISPQKVSTVYLGGGRKHIAKGKIRRNIVELGAQQYLLYVGGIDFRKNITSMLKDFFELKTTYPELKLITVGKEFGLTEVLSDLGWNKVMSSNPIFAKDVVVPGFLSDKELEYLYQHAEAFIFPSRYEGFGLPILEAMEQGCPVVAYANSSIIEIAGDAAILVKDGNPLVPAIKKLLEEPKLKQKLVQKGRFQVTKFTWEKTAFETMTIINKVVNKK